MRKTIAEKFFEDIANEQSVMDARQAFTELIQKSDIVATTVLSALLDSKNPLIADLSLDEMILGLARSMMNLSHLYFENKEEYSQTEMLVRHEISERVTEAIVAPKPCAECDSCQVGAECENPNHQNIPFSAIPMLSSVLVEEAYWEACLNDKMN